ncbi:MAG: chemotaxis protein CheD [Cytophagales bacterium]|nr:chemotaxis protein CheD [Cytophagales bacterium]
MGNIKRSENYQTHYLYPSALFADPAPHQVTTILGTCVAVCLWDPINKIGGINHYMLPFWNGEGLASPKYGNIAIEKLVQKMMSMGSSPDYLQAKVFGGKGGSGGQSSSVYQIGERNITVAQEMLKEYGIPIVSSSTGGEFGRKLLFFTDTGEVLMKFLKS